MHRIIKHTTILNLGICYAIVFGGFIANPYSDFFLAFPALYEPMKSLWPSEAFWGGVFIVTGIAAFVLKLCGQAHWGSFTMAALFVFISVLFFQGDVARPAWALFLLLSIFNLIQWRANEWNKQQH